MEKKAPDIVSFLIVLSGILFSLGASASLRLFYADDTILAAVGVTLCVFIMSLGAHFGLSMRGYTFSIMKYVGSSLVLLALIWFLVIIPFQYSGFFFITWIMSVLLYALYIRWLEKAKLRSLILWAALIVCLSVFFSSGNIEDGQIIDPFVFVWSLSITCIVPMSFFNVDSEEVDDSDRKVINE